MWTSPDPIEQFWNSYSYCGSNPVNRVDIEGTYSPEFVDNEATKKGTSAKDMITDLAKNLHSKRGMTKATALQTAYEILAQLGDIFVGGNIVFDPVTAAFLVDSYKERQELLKNENRTKVQEERLKQIDEQVQNKVDKLIERLNKAKKDSKNAKKLYEQYKAYQKYFEEKPKTSTPGGAGSGGLVNVDDIRPTGDTQYAAEKSGGGNAGVGSSNDNDVDK